MEIEQVDSYFRKLFWNLRIKYAVGVTRSKQLKELIEEAMILGKEPEELADELAKQERIPLNLEALN